MTRRFALLLTVLLIVGCVPKPQFLGTWTSTGSTLSLNSDSVLVIAAPLGQSRRGRWALIEKGIVGFQLDGDDKSSHSRWWVSDDGRTLTLTPVTADGREHAEDMATYLRQ